MSPIPKRRVAAANKIETRRELLQITGSLARRNQFWDEHAPHLSDGRPPATADEKAVGKALAAERQTDDEDAWIWVMLQTRRRRQREREEWLLENDVLAGEALEYLVSYRIAKGALDG